MVTEVLLLRLAFVSPSRITQALSAGCTKATQVRSKLIASQGEQRDNQDVCYESKVTVSLLPTEIIHTTAVNGIVGLGICLLSQITLGTGCPLLFELDLGTEGHHARAELLAVGRSLVWDSQYWYFASDRNTRTVRTKIGTSTSHLTGRYLPLVQRAA